ncbi:hypothetical protein C8R42DRAFT_724403 [Lentinula raphanica]|nr:hypothetical protein C8R42DRAFT_724403 [Lentinula raphanica]
MSTPELPEVRCVTCEAAEMAQLLRCLAASQHEMQQLRAEMVELIQQMNHVIDVKDAPPLLHLFEELEAMYAKFSALVDEKNGYNASARKVNMPRVWHAQFPQNLAGNPTHPLVQPIHILWRNPYTSSGATHETLLYPARHNRCPTDYVHALAFSTNGHYLASATNDNKLRVYDIQRSFMTVWEEETHHPCTVVVWRENALFVGSMDGNILCCYPSKKSDLIYKTDDAIHAIEFNQRGDFLLVCAGTDVFLFEKRVYIVVKDLMNFSLTYSIVSGRWAYRGYLPRPDPFGEYDDGDIYPIIATGAHFLDDSDQCLIGYLYNGFW